MSVSPPGLLNDQTIRRAIFVSQSLQFREIEPVNFSTEREKG